MRENHHEMDQPMVLGRGSFCYALYLFHIFFGVQITYNDYRYAIFIKEDKYKNKKFDGHGNMKKYEFFSSMFFIFFLLFSHCAP